VFNSDLDYGWCEHGRFSRAMFHFVTIQNPASLFCWAVYVWVELKECKYLYCRQIYTRSFQMLSVYQHIAK
jgi:hypothetical protein